MTIESHNVSNELMEELRRHYSEAEIVEIAAMAGIFNYFNRMANALEIEPTKPGEGIE